MIASMACHMIFRLTIDQYFVCRNQRG